jgi:outer membrane protein TolC
MRRVPVWGVFLLLAALRGIPAAPLAAQELAGSGEEGILSLDRAVELALEQSLSLQKSFIDLDTAGVAAANLWSQIFPGLSLSGGLTYRPDLSGGSAPSDPLGYSASFGLSLQLNPSLASSMKIIDLAYRVQLLSYENARRQLAIQVTKTFYTLISEGENLAHLEEIRGLAERQLDKNQIAFQNGLIGQLSVLQSRLSLETARLNLSRAETSYAAKRGDFLVLLGLDPGMAISIPGDIEIERVEADPEALIREYLGKRPDIIAQRNTIERLELVLEQTALNARSPSLTFSTQWSGSGSGGGFNNSLSLGLNLGIPLDAWIPGTRSNQSIRSARMEVEKAQLDLRNTENQAMSEIRSLTENLRNSWDSIEIARLRVEIAERTYQLTEEGFRSGTVESLTLEDARNTMAQARQQFLEGELAYQTMILDLAAALNIEWNELARSIL